MLVAWQLWTKIAVPLNLSFPHTVDVGSFYSDIHANIRQQAAENRLPPTSAEFRDWLARRFADPGGLSALDAGTGAHALNAQACRDAGFGDVRSIDINPEVVEVHRDLGARYGSVLDIPFPDDRFDLTVCAGVAHHTPNPDRAFAELARVTRPGGTAFISIYTFRRSLAAVFVRGLRVAARAVNFRSPASFLRRSAVVNN